MQLDLVLNEDQKKERFKISLETKNKTIDMSEVSTSQVAEPSEIKVEYTQQTNSTRNLESSSESPQESLIPKFSSSMPENHFHSIQLRPIFHSEYPFFSRSTNHTLRESKAPFPQNPSFQTYFPAPQRFTGTQPPYYTDMTTYEEQYKPNILNFQHSSLPLTTSNISGASRINYFPERQAGKSAVLHKESILNENSVQVCIQ